MGAPTSCHTGNQLHRRQQWRVACVTAGVISWRLMKAVVSSSLIRAAACVCLLARMLDRLRVEGGVLYVEFKRRQGVAAISELVSLWHSCLVLVLFLR